MAPKNKGEKSQDTAQPINNALATQGTTAIVEADDFDDVAGQGFEENDASLVKIPFLVVLQPSSRVIKMPRKQRPPHLQNAEAGMLYDNVSEELIDVTDENKPGLEFIPVFFKKVFVRFAPDMGGFKGKYEPDSPIVKKAIAEGSFADYRVDEPGKARAECDELNEVIELYAVYASPSTGALRAVVINVGGSGITMFKDWNGKVSGFRRKKPDGTLYPPPLRTHRTEFRTEYDPSKGEDKAYYKTLFSPAVKNGNGTGDLLASQIRRADPRFVMAEQFYKDLMDMKVSADYSTLDRGGMAGNGGGAPKADKKADEGF